MKYFKEIKITENQKTLFKFNYIWYNEGHNNYTRFPEPIWTHKVELISKYNSEIENNGLKGFNQVVGHCGVKNIEVYEFEKEKIVFTDRRLNEYCIIDVEKNNLLIK